MRMFTPRRVASAIAATLLFLSAAARADEPRRFTLAECLERAQRQSPVVAAAGARVAFARAQQTEARYAPFFDLRMGAQGGVIPRVRDANGNETFSTDLTRLSVDSLGSLSPVVRFSLEYRLPIYTFGKISSARDAAGANVRVQEWDKEKARLQVRAEVRKAYFGAQAARDGEYLLREARRSLDRTIASISEKLDRGEPGVDEGDRLRLEFVADDLDNRVGDLEKKESEALAALRFLTGTQSAFELVDAPLSRPSQPLRPVVEYLTAARLYRPEVNMARAGVVARQAQLAGARARLLPDFAMLGAGSYWGAPALAKEKNVVQDSVVFGLGMQWTLDFLPGWARLDQAAAQVEEVLSQARLALGGVAVEVETQYAAVVEAMKREEVTARAEKRAKSWYVTVQDAVELGTKDERASVEPLRYHLSARAEHIRALFDLYVATTELARVSGWDAAAPSG